MIRYKSADDLIDDCKITAPDELWNIEAIAEKYGAIVKEKAHSETDAYIFGAGNKAIIRVNEFGDFDEKTERARQRFSIAHEIGHWMLHFDNSNLRSFNCSNVNDESRGNKDSNGFEKEANNFAADFLMPAVFFEKEINDKPPIIDTVSPLKKIFQVSFTAAAIRLTKLNNKPVMLVCSSSSGRNWCYKSKKVPDNLELHDNIIKGTGAMDLLKGLKKNAITHEVARGLWFKGDERNSTLVTESSQTMYGGSVVLSLLSWNES